MTPHTPQAASALLGLAQGYFEACLAGDEIMASEAINGMIEAIQSRHAYTHLRLFMMPECHARGAQNGSQTVMVALPLSVFQTVIQPLLEILEKDRENIQLRPFPSFAERVWPRATRN